MHTTTGFHAIIGNIGLTPTGAVLHSLGARAAPHPQLLARQRLVAQMKADAEENERIRAKRAKMHRRGRNRAKPAISACHPQVGTAAWRWRLSMNQEQHHAMVGQDRITSRQVDELVGLARGIAADGMVNQSEVEFLQKWLA